MIVVVDNRDSFTFNLVQLVRALAADVCVVSADSVSVEDVAARKPSGILLSPGPGTPSNAGATLPILRAFAQRVPIFGVCLGHQAIAEAFGGRIVRAPRPMHGRTSLVEHDGRGVFAGLPVPLRQMRYHSLVVAPDSVPACLEVSARTPDGVIMGLRHRGGGIEGVQFHPESVLSEHGDALVRNFVRTVSTATGASL